MTDTDLRVALARLGLTQKAFARYIGRDSDTVSRWARGEVPVPHIVSVVIELMEYRQHILRGERLSIDARVMERLSAP